VRVVSLASGSSGNATLIESGGTALLLDAGLNPRTLAGRLLKMGRSPRDLAGIVLTHEHTDHTSSALGLAREYALPLIGDGRTLAAVLANVVPTESKDYAIDPHPAGSTWQMGPFTLTSIPIPHDAVAPCGYLIATDAWKICLITDCGEMTDTILQALKQAHLIIIEANHDRQMLLKGPYPAHLKKRILGPQGHLANDQTAEALFNCLDASPHWVWLAHLSKTNNTPEVAQAAMVQRLGGRRMRTTKLAVAPPGLGPVWNSTQLFDQPTLF